MNERRREKGELSSKFEEKFIFIMYTIFILFAH